MNTLAVTVKSPSSIRQFFDPTHIDQILSLAQKFYEAKCFGSDVQNAAQALVKIQAGYEMGIPPVEAMNSLYIIKGKITMWGAAMTKRLRQNGWEIEYEDEKTPKNTWASSTATITKGDKTYSYKATADEVEKGLGWKLSPLNKLRFHAIGQLIKFHVPEILDAGVYYSAEEIQDLEDQHIEKATVTVVENTASVETDKIDNTQVEQEAPAEDGPHMRSLKKELIGRGAKSLEGALKILNDSLGTEIMSFDFTEDTASEILIKLLQVSQEASEEKPESEEEEAVTPDKSSLAKHTDYSDPKKVAALIAGLDSSYELLGIMEEIAKTYDEGDITKTTRDQLISLCNDKAKEIRNTLSKPKTKKAKKSRTVA